MLILPVEEAKAGMILAAPVTHPEHPDQDLLKGGYTLEDSILPLLKQMGVTQIYVEFPGLDDLDQHLVPNLSPARQMIYKQIKDAVHLTQKSTQPKISYAEYYGSIREMILTLMGQGQHPVYLEHMSRMGDDVVSHSAAVAHLGLLLGIKLETYLIAQRKRLPAHHAKEVVNIGVAGMMHDIGKLALPKELQHHSGVELPEDPKQLEHWQEHCWLGYEMIHGGVEPSAAAAVLHHHQHWDGSGFPTTTYRDGTRATPKENRIHIFARIVAVADLYDRLATPMGSKVRLSNLEILHLMRSKYTPWCDPVVLKVLEAVAPPFPPGAMVKLSDDTAAVVVEANHSSPYRPTVRRMLGTEMELDAVRVDLSENGAPSITHVGSTSVEGLIPDLATA
ncbi:MAG TPA: HD domain-containing phosphohydrolase [Tepidisphaeraceae bacterium]|nr:HD domain-containing phosphohydrolase [Tepidisphaeraceae bacterium]